MRWRWAWRLWLLLASACVDDVDLRPPPASPVRADTGSKEPDPEPPDTGVEPPGPPSCAELGHVCISPGCPDGFVETGDPCEDPTGGQRCCARFESCESVGYFCVEIQGPPECPTPLVPQAYPCQSQTAICCSN